MDYLKIYNNIIERGKLRGHSKKKLDGYYESHHIKPKCLGGKDCKSNLVLLTAKEHYICHLLLEKLYPNEKGLSLAVYRMIYGNRKFRNEILITSKTINNIKQKAIESIRHYSKTRIHSDTERQIISKKAKQRWQIFKESGRINEIKENISNATKKAMQNQTVIEKTRINKGSKWYTNKHTNESMHWYHGMELPDENVWRPGRPKMTKETKEKIKKTQVNIGYYYNDDLQENRRFNKNESIPDGWINGRKKEYFGNSKRNKQLNKRNKLITLDGTL